MPKPDFPALLPPGLHPSTFPALHSMAVAPFESDATRTELYGRLMAWVASIQACGLGGTLWLDGSFLTEKPAPSDIDCVLWMPRWRSVADQTEENRRKLDKLLDKQLARANFGLDLYLELPPPETLIHRQAYWKGFFGYCHDGVTAKGFVEVAL